MKKALLILIILLVVIFFQFCASNKDNSNEITSEENSNKITSKIQQTKSIDDFMISKETLKSLYVDLYGYENENIEFEITKEYIYSNDGTLANTKYSTGGIVYIYDDQRNLVGERLIEEEDKTIYEFHRLQHYVENFDEYIIYLKDPGNKIETRGEVTLDDKGRVIKDTITYEDGRGVEENIYKYDDKGRLSQIITIEENGFSSSYSFTYDENNRIIHVSWGGCELGSSDKYYTYDENGLLIKLYHESRSDTRDGMNFTILFEYIEK